MFARIKLLAKTSNLAIALQGNKGGGSHDSPQLSYKRDDILVLTAYVSLPNVHVPTKERNAYFPIGRLKARGSRAMFKRTRTRHLASSPAKRSIFSAEILPARPPHSSRSL